MVGGMTGEDQVKRTIQACRRAGLPVIDGEECTCSLDGQLVVLAHEDGLQVVWPYHPHCRIHRPRDREVSAPGDKDAARPSEVAGRGGGEAQAKRGRSTRLVSEVVRGLAAQLELRFHEDAELARRLRDAQERPQSANDRWRGLHPDGLAAIYGEHPAAVEAARAENRSEVLGAPDVLAALQEVHWRIHGAFLAYQAAGGRPAARCGHGRDDPPARRCARAGWLDRGAGTSGKRSRARNDKPVTRRNQRWERR